MRPHSVRPSPPPADWERTAIGVGPGGRECAGVSQPGSGLGVSRRGRVDVSAHRLSASQFFRLHVPVHNNKLCMVGRSTRLRLPAILPAVRLALDMGRLKNQCVRTENHSRNNHTPPPPHHSALPPDLQHKQGLASRRPPPPPPPPPPHMARGGCKWNMRCAWL